MMNCDIYFDCASTVRPYPEVLKVFQDVSVNSFANASSNHALGFACSSMLQRARMQVAKYLRVLPEEVIFTSGASEGNNLAIKGVAYHNRGWAKRIITTKAEHPSVLEVFHKLEKEGFDVVYLDYDEEGRLNLQELEEALSVPTSLVSVMAVNNEVGYLFPIEEVSRIVRSHSRALFHVDATQAIGKEKLNSEVYDLMTFSGHKIGGLKGSGVLVKKKNVLLEEQILGGEQENGLRAGTTPLGLDCSIATALRLSLSSEAQRRNQVIKVNSYLRSELSKIEEVEITSRGKCTPFILAFALREHKGSVIAEALSNRGIYVSTKSACSSREEGYSYVLKNAGYEEKIAYNGIRLSFSGNETLEQAETFMKNLREILSEIKVKEEEK